MRGDIYRLRHDRASKGREQAGDRYAVIVQSNDLMTSTWIAVPTSTSATATSFRPELRLGETTTRALCEHVAAIDPQARLGDLVGRASLAEMQAIDDALRAVLALD